MFGVSQFHAGEAILHSSFLRLELQFLIIVICNNCNVTAEYPLPLFTIEDYRLFHAQIFKRSLKIELSIHRGNSRYISSVKKN